MLTEKKVWIEVTVKYLDTASQDDVLFYFFTNSSRFGTSVLHPNSAPISKTGCTIPWKYKFVFILVTSNIVKRQNWK